MDQKELFELSERERELKDQIDWICELQKQLPVLWSEIRDCRNKKAEVIRLLYFSRKMKQSELAKAAGMQQGSISRIVSEQVYYKKR